MESEKIDFVIIWVDGSDIEWRKEKNKYTPEEETDDREIRYRDYDNLQYWFRGVEKFAPWVNKIYFVTCGQKPIWLNEKNPKLVLVDHKDFIPAKYLPTFSSHPIELNLHRIKGLSDKFVYFNDDMFIIKKVDKKDFFKNGLPCDTAVINAHPSIRNALHISETNMEIINDYFHKNVVLRQHPFQWFRLKYGAKLFRTLCLLPWPEFIGIWDHHLATSFLRETFVTLWNKEYNMLDKTSSHKFRYAMDVNQWLFRYWQIVSGQFYPRSVSFGKSFVLKDNNKNNQRIFNIIKKQRYKMICVNDGIEDEKNFVVAKESLLNAFESILPEKSTFEN